MGWRVRPCPSVRPGSEGNVPLAVFRADCAASHFPRGFVPRTLPPARNAPPCRRISSRHPTTRGRRVHSAPAVQLARSPGHFPRLSRLHPHMQQRPATAAVWTMSAGRPRLLYSKPTVQLLRPTALTVCPGSITKTLLANLSSCPVSCCLAEFFVHRDERRDQKAAAQGQGIANLAPPAK